MPKRKTLAPTPVTRTPFINLTNNLSSQQQQQTNNLSSQQQHQTNNLLPQQWQLRKKL